ILGLWVRSYWAADMMIIDAGGKTAALVSVRGVIVYHAEADGKDDASVLHAARHFDSVDPAQFVRTLPNGAETIHGAGLSFHKQRLYSDGRGLDITLTMPTWMFLLIGGAKAIIWSVRRIVQKGVAGGFSRSRTLA